MTTTVPANGIQQLADSIMHGVVRVLGNKLTGHETRAIEIMREEAQGFFAIGPRAAEYENTRAALLAHTLSEQWALADIVTNCVARFLGQK